MIVFKCLKCREQMEAPNELAGDTLNCPRCGNVCAVPASAPVAMASTAKVQTIEQTGKRYKAWMLVAGLMIVVGAVMMFAGEKNTAVVGFGLVLFGLPILLLARLGAWWNHG